MQEVAGWFAAPNVGIGVVAGAVSDNLTILDFDRPGLYEEWAALAEDNGQGELVNRLVWVETPSGGRHGYARCTEPVRGSEKLARDEKGKTLIETKAEGGYVVAPGSPPACHSTGKTYNLVSGNLNAVPVLTPQEVRALHLLAGLFHAYADPKREYKPQEQRERQPGDGLLPGDDYNERGDVLTLLQKHHWKVRRYGAGYALTRPGKSGAGLSATYNIVPGRLYVFSSNALPFETDRPYTPFAVYALLEHEGNFHEAARALSAEGYGERSQPAPRPALNPDRLFRVEAIDREDEPHPANTETFPPISDNEERDSDEAEFTPTESLYPLTIADKDAPHCSESEQCLPGLLPEIAALYSCLPAKVTRAGLEILPEADAEERRAIFRGLFNLAKDTEDWLFWAQGDAWNALPGDYGAKCRFAEATCGKERYLRQRQIGSCARAWPKPMRNRATRSFYVLTASIKDTATRESLLKRYEAREFESWDAMKDEIRLIKAAQKERKERSERAHEAKRGKQGGALDGSPSNTSGFLLAIRAEIDALAALPGGEDELPQIYALIRKRREEAENATCQKREHCSDSEQCQSNVSHSEQCSAKEESIDSLFSQFTAECAPHCSDSEQCSPEPPAAPALVVVSLEASECAAPEELTPEEVCPVAPLLAALDRGELPTDRRTIPKVPATLEEGEIPEFDVMNFAVYVGGQARTYRLHRGPKRQPALDELLLCQAAWQQWTEDRTPVPRLVGSP